MTKRMHWLKAAVLLTCFCQAALSQPKSSWTTPQEPFQIAANLYYVGSLDLAAFLVVTPAGNILINSNLETSPPQIRASIEQLGFHWPDTKILLNGQAHFDHAAGSAQVIRETGAKLMAMEGDAEVIESGGAKDFSRNSLSSFPPAHVSRVLHDGDTVELGGTILTAHRTAGHTRGCTTWTMQVLQNGRQLNVVVVGGFTVLDSYRLHASPGHPESYPGIQRDFEHSFAVWRSLPCDIFLGAHGSYFQMTEKLARVKTQGNAVWIDPKGYASAIDEAEKDFRDHLAQESH